MFNCSISPGSKSKVKSSVQRAIRTQLVTTYPLLAPHIDEIIPKKEQLDAMKMCVRLLSLLALYSIVETVLLLSSDPVQLNCLEPAHLEALSWPDRQKLIHCQLDQIE